MTQMNKLSHHSVQISEVIISDPWSSYANCLTRLVYIWSNILVIMLLISVYKMNATAC